MKYEIQRTSQFKKDYKTAVKRNLDMEQLKKIVKILAEGEALPEEYDDHTLKGKYSGYREYCQYSLTHIPVIISA